MSHRPPLERPLQRRAAGWAQAVVLVSTLVAACTSLPPEPAVSQEGDVPLQWSQGRAAAGLGAQAAWWTAFGDPLLPDLVEQALRANTSVLAARATLRQAVALRDAAQSARQPQLGGSATVQHGTSDGRSTGGTAHAGLEARWELDLFGGLRSAVRTAEASLQASRASLGDVQVSIAAEVGLGYIGLRAAQSRELIASDNLASQLRTLQLTEWRLQAGLLSALEVEQARAAAAQLQAQVPALHTAVVQSTQALAVLTGRPPAALDEQLALRQPVPQAASDLALQLPADTLRQRPDVRAAEQQVLAALGRVAQADAARYPSFSLGGSLGLQALALALGSGGATTLLTTALASVSGPLWDGGAARAQVQAQLAAADQARAAYRGTVLTALREVEDALVALRGDRLRVQHLQQAVAAATQAATLAAQRYDSGLVDLQVVLETQRTRLSTQDGLSTATADVSTDHVRLFKALGGGWSPLSADGIAADVPRPSVASTTPR